MAENSNLPVVVEASTEQIQNLIYVIRGKQVMIDSDLAMLSSVLKSDVAVQVNINIMDTFVEIHRYMTDTMYLFKQVNNIETRQIESDIKREAFEKKQKNSWHRYLSTYPTMRKIARRSSSMGRYLMLSA